MVPAAAILVCIGVVASRRARRRATRDDDPAPHALGDRELGADPQLSAAGTAAKTLGAPPPRPQGRHLPGALEPRRRRVAPQPDLATHRDLRHQRPADQGRDRGAGRMLRAILGVIHAPSVGFIQLHFTPILHGDCMISRPFRPQALPQPAQEEARPLRQSRGRPSSRRMRHALERAPRLSTQAMRRPRSRRSTCATGRRPGGGAFSNPDGVLAGRRDAAKAYAPPPVVQARFQAISPCRCAALASRRRAWRIGSV